jgi:hypothetical protein
MRRKGDLPTRTCEACGRPFVWRRKWERVWDTIRHCSDRCRDELRRARKAAAADSGAR